MSSKLKIQMAKSLRFLSDKNYIRLIYRIKIGKKLNLENPKTLSEKIQWLKLFDHNPEYVKMVDKLEAKDYVKDLIGEAYITPTLGVWDSFDEIDFNKLPNKFVLKCNHDSGSIAISTDKSRFDKNSARNLLNQGLKTNYYLLAREWPYKNVKKKIFAEEYMENNAEEGLHDYKVWCFNGYAKYVQYISGRAGENTYEGFYDNEWNLQPFTCHNPKIQTQIKRPAQLDELFRLANILAKDLPVSRIDFYILPNDNIRFGEITLYPLAGLEHWHPEETDRNLGEMITLPYRNKI